MDNYYTPRIEEIRVGFEYEVKIWTVDKSTLPEGVTLEEYKTSGPFSYRIEKYPDVRASSHWAMRKVDSTTFLHPISVKILEGGVRVKHLDGEDIESFDFEFINTNKMSYWYEMEFCGNRLPSSSYSFWKIYLRHDPDRNIIKIEADISSGDRETFFEGTIKNKSRLKEILTDIGILKTR